MHGSGFICLEWQWLWDVYISGNWIWKRKSGVSLGKQHLGPDQIFYTIQETRDENHIRVEHDDVINWKPFPRYWPFVRGIHRFPVNSPSQRPVTRNFDVFFDLHPNKRLSKQWWGWWFETPSHPLWRHCNGYMGWWTPRGNFKEVSTCRDLLLM